MRQSVVHLELHTYDLETAAAFYSDLLGWQTQEIQSRWGRYRALLLGDGPGGAIVDGGIVECGTWPAAWLPYVEVDGIEIATDRALGLGASLLLGPREGPAGWRSVVATPAGGEVALWQQKR